MCSPFTCRSGCAFVYIGWVIVPVAYAILVIVCANDKLPCLTESKTFLWLSLCYDNTQGLRLRSQPHCAKLCINTQSEVINWRDTANERWEGKQRHKDEVTRSHSRSVKELGLLSASLVAYPLDPHCKKPFANIFLKPIIFSFIPVSGSKSSFLHPSPLPSYCIHKGHAWVTELIRNSNRNLSLGYVQGDALCISCSFKIFSKVRRTDRWGV